MKPMFHKLILAAAVAAIVPLVGAPASRAADTIKMGVVGPHSGDLAPYGIPSLQAAKLVVKDINAKGGVLGSSDSKPRVILLLPPETFHSFTKSHAQHINRLTRQVLSALGAGNDECSASIAHKTHVQHPIRLYDET